MLSLAGGRGPAPAHSPWGTAGTLLCTTAPGTPACTPGFTACSWPATREPSEACTFTLQQGTLAMELVLLHTKEIPSATSQIFCGKFWVWKSSLILLCTALQKEAYPVMCYEDFSSSQLSVFSYSTQPVTSLSLLSPTRASCRQCPQPCCAGQRSCSWAELALCSAARLPGAPLGPRSPAQLSSRGPAQGLPCSAPHQAPCPWPWGCRGTCWETA